MASGTIVYPTVKPNVIYIERTGTTTFSLAPGASVDVYNSGYVEAPDTPDGYSWICSGVRANGNAGVVATGMNNYFVCNTTAYTLSNLTATLWAIAVR